jgi:polysaccharide export outer membrane protein
MAVPIATAAAIAAPAPGSMDSGFSERTPRYRLCPGDQMDLKFEFTAEFDQAKVTIQPDGYVNLREIGDVHIAGLTVPEARKAVETAYSKILAKPVISVVLTDFNKPYFVATGEVGHPGKYELRADTTVVEALGIAGGLNHDSRHSEVWLFHRQADGNVQKRRLDVKRMLAKGDLNEDIRVQAGDTLYVPQNTFSKLKGVVIPTMTLAPPLPF